MSVLKSPIDTQQIPNVGDDREHELQHATRGDHDLTATLSGALVSKARPREIASWVDDSGRRIVGETLMAMLTTTTVRSRAPARDAGLGHRHMADDLTETVEAAITGNAGAWQDLSRRFSGMITAIARSHRLGEMDVAEVFQTTWLRLVENIERIEHPERLGGWLATTARRESLRLIRLGSRCTFDSDALALAPDKNAPELDSGTLLDERTALVREAFARLSPRCQELLAVLTGDEPPSYKEISDALSIPIGSIGPTRGRCLEHLRRIISTLDPNF